MLRFCAVLFAVLSLSACENIDDLSKTPNPIGEFSLGYNVVVAPNIVKAPVSREASNEVWIEAMTKAIDERFSRFDGDQIYHFGISLEGYALAQPGIPVLLSPKSVLIFKLTVWDDATGTKLNSEPEQITVLETLDGDTIVGSGLTKTGDEQMKTLSDNAAKLIQRWLIRQHRSEKWFKRRPETAAAQAAANAEKIEKAKISLEPATGATVPEQTKEEAAVETLEKTAQKTEEKAVAATQAALPKSDVLEVAPAAVAGSN